MKTTTKMSLNDATPADWDKARQEYIESIWGKDNDEDWVDNIRPDNVNHPDHYNQGGIECIDYIKQQLGDSFEAYCQGNVIKYLHRWRYKNGLEDLHKAQWYLNAMVTAVEEIGE